VVVNVFLTSTTAVLNHFVEGSQIQTYDFVREPHKKKLPQVNWRVLFYCTNEKSVTQIIRCVTVRHYLSQGILSQQESDTKLLLVYISPTK